MEKQDFPQKSQRYRVSAMDDYISGRNSPHSSSAPLPLSALRLLVPPLRLVSAAIWQTVQQKVVADYGMLEEFVSMVTDIVPELLTSSQRAQLTLGLRARMILELCQLEAPELELLQPHLDRLQTLIEAWLMEAGGADTEEPNSNFGDFVKNLLRNPDDRQQFFQRVFHEEFGPSYDEELNTLVWLFLSRLEKFLPVPTFQQAASVFDGVSGVLADCVQSVSECDELKALLQYHKDPNQLDHNDSFSDGACIISALKLPSLKTAGTPTTQAHDNSQDGALSCSSDLQWDSETLCHSAQMNSDTVKKHLTGETTMAQTSSTPETNETQLPLGDAKRPEENMDLLQSQPEHASGSVKECHVQLARLDTPVSSNSRPVRPNRGLRMKKFLMEERRELPDETLPASKFASRKAKAFRRTPPAVSEDDSSYFHKNLSYMAPISSCSEEDSWSYYSEEDSPQTDGSRSSMADSWSYYSDDDSFFLTPVNSSSASDSFFSSKNTSTKNASAPCLKLSNKKASTLRKTRKLQCLICKEHVKTNLRTHMKTHFPDSVYACPRCDTRYKLLTSLLVHLKKTCFEYGQQCIDTDKPDETKNLYKCDKCKEAFRYKVSLQRHILTHHELYCSVCRKVLRDAATLARHKASHMQFQCTRCDQYFTVFKHMLRHCENVHKISRPFKCNHCPKTFPKLHLLIRHEWQHTGRLPYQCAQCSLRFKSDCDLAVHVRVHTREKPHLCTQCGKTFAHGSNLLRHMNLLHSESRNDKKHSCSQCEKSFKEKGSLKKHQRSKHLHELFRYPCPYCGKMVSSSTMARHKLIHTGEKPFKCTVPDCDKFYRSTSEVKRHVLVHHSTDRPFKCDICGKGFVRKSCLNMHAKTHSGEKPFVCQICGKAFPKAYSMLRHKKLLHASVKC
ncbi:uncharacterized protein PAE49_001401 [Odontesthes bonariensis]|uniref:uncharacterized protein LOC142374305 n=1 Tax=Odontesthes bonariensis TaxID=219752 RepID=UPI003F5861EE